MHRLTTLVVLVLVALVVACGGAPTPKPPVTPPPVDTLAEHVLDSVSQTFVVERKIDAGLKVESGGYYCQIHFYQDWVAIQVGDTLHNCLIVPQDP